MQFFHERSARDEAALHQAAKEDLPDLALLDRASSELFRVAQEAKAIDPQTGCRPASSASENGVLAAAAMALRTGRALGLLVRNGYGVEALGLVRRLGEIAQHAAGCAQDPTGRYARDWGEGRGGTGKPSSAFVRGVREPEEVRHKWNFLSQLEHANLGPYLELMCAFDDYGEVVHPVAPARHEGIDALVISSAATDLTRTSAAVCKTHPRLSDEAVLELGGELLARQDAADARAEAWVSARLSERRSHPGDDAPAGR